MESGTRTAHRGRAFPFGWLHVVAHGHLPRFRWYDVGWASIRGCEVCEAKKAARFPCR